MSDELIDPLAIAKLNLEQVEGMPTRLRAGAQTAKQPQV
jgi:hypothetical protein